jgi:hypothetical protein
MNETKVNKVKEANESVNYSVITAENDTEEELEGIDRESLTDWGDYPIDSLLIRSESRTVYEVIRRINNNVFILNPDFQRDFVWDEVKQSRFIESVLMRIPLPVFYLAEQEDGKIIVVDGLQRLMTFKRYLNNQFALKGLKHPRVDLNGKRFQNLDSKFQNRIEDTNLTLYLIDSKVPERARLDIFERVNSGVPLSRQQMRNSLYFGQGTIWLREEAKSTWFRKATGRSLKTETMRDREFVNRFCGFYLLGIRKYNGGMDEFLAETLKHMNKKMTDEDLKQLSIVFQKSMRNNYNVFGQHAFRKHESQSWRRSVINASLFDVFSVTFARLEENYIKEKAPIIREKFYGLMKNYNFYEAITLSTNSLTRVRERFNIVNETFQDI